ncbi:hypothetical protein O1R50_10045 [Glycomyces luteolus]|uniref:Uncharacterized protein n=1 Tax=Glycomyces luteolus TaxID=2670330 RepID=A0A9X3SQC3_9ACTN|nr:hypothetical protein [Glycomyces luteolus]MDA1359966.1 hypothetical protein [Glycomyces luteolus]
MPRVVDEPPLTRRGKLARIAATLAMTLALMATSLWGTDDFFPFAPFKMYSHAHDPDGWANSTSLILTDATGRSFPVGDNDTGFRRAELEGQLSRFREDPGLLALIAEAYEDAHPGSPEIVAAEVRIVHYELKDGERTGAERTEIAAAWTEGPDAP